MQTQRSCANKMETKQRIEAFATTFGQGDPKESINLRLPVGLVAEARALGIDVSEAAESAVAAAVAARRRELWLAENAEALESSNSFVEQHGLPLSRLRNF